jgi:tRNA threonylcarbamoyladenosine biosynthesis protein TsaB
MQLVIDSATAACSVALLGEDGEPLAELHEVVGRGHAERLVPMIAELLDGRRPAAILVDCGPGSFTGVRVGLAAAHGLAIGWRDPLAATTGLRSLAPSAAALFLRADLVVGSGAELVVAARGHGRAVAALPRAADARLLPPALRSLQARPIYGRAPDAKPMT